MKKVISLVALLLAACATPQDVIKKGLSRSFASTANVTNTVECIKRHAIDFRAKGLAKTQPSTAPGGVEVYVDTDLGATIVAVVTPAAAGSNVTVYYESDRLRRLYADDLIRGCAK